MILKAGHTSTLCSSVNAATERRKHTRVDFLWITQRIRTIASYSDQLGRLDASVFTSMFLFLFLFTYWQIMPFGHITPVRMVVRWLMFYHIQPCICLSFFEMILLSCLKLCLTVEHSILQLQLGEKTTSECVGRVSNLTKLTVMFAWATIIVLDILILWEVYDGMFHFM